GFLNRSVSCLPPVRQDILEIAVFVTAGIKLRTQRGPCPRHFYWANFFDYAGEEMPGPSAADIVLWDLIGQAATSIAWPRRPSRRLASTSSSGRIGKQDWDSI